MMIHRRTQDRNGNRVLLAQGAAALVAFTLMLGVAARGIQSQPDVQAQRSSSQIAELSPVQLDTKPETRETHSGVFTGTIVKDGEVFVFRDQSGKVYRLRSQAKVLKFEGTPVKVTGKLEEETGLLQVDKIQTAGA